MPIKRLLIVSLAVVLLIFQKMEGQHFSDLRTRFENHPENKEQALAYLHLKIEKAKDISNDKQLVECYKEGVYYSKTRAQKLQYADSCIFAAHKSENSNLISNAHLLKGGIYYFNYKRYKPALDECLLAYHYSKNTNDLYLKYKIYYQIGIIKSYLGYYRDALVHFEACRKFFEANIKRNAHPNLIYNYTKGYLNSIHQSIICYRQLKEYQKADALIQTGSVFTALTHGYNEEKNYFIKCKGISEYYHRHYENSIALLKKALPGFEKRNDYAWYSISNFYIGKNYLKIQQEKKALQYFMKVDSVFMKEPFIFPELRENYKQLIEYYKKRKATEEELHYNKTLLKVDSIITKDFRYLSSRIHKEFDTEPFKEARQAMQMKQKWVALIIAICLSLVVGFVILNWIKYKKRSKIKSQYKILEAKLKDQKGNYLKSTVKKKKAKAKFNEVIFKDIEKKLEAFEQNQQFREKGITLNKLAKKFGTNSNYLSHVIHETKKMTFNRYLGELRIGYITELLYYNKTYLKYTVETLADECGLATRQNFSDLFQEINGMRPKDFIQQRRDELEPQAIQDDEYEL